MSVVNGQVEDDVNRVVGEQVVDRFVRSAAMSLGERDRAGGIKVRRGNEPDLGVRLGVPGVSAGDVAGPDDADSKRAHPGEASVIHVRM